MVRRKEKRVPLNKCGLCGKSACYRKTLCKACEEKYYDEKNKNNKTTLPHFVIDQRRILQQK